MKGDLIQHFGLKVRHFPKLCLASTDLPFAGSH
jgi:hypothetical protein